LDESDQSRSAKNKTEESASASSGDEQDDVIGAAAEQEELTKPQEFTLDQFMCSDGILRDSNQIEQETNYKPPLKPIVLKGKKL
jgi:hypothetical protein